MIYPVLAITGATCTSKTDLAISLAKQANATVLPLDQLHRYRYLQEGTGLATQQLAQVVHYGYQILSPWQVSGPEAYIRWLKSALAQIAATGPVVIEGGCTSYLSKMLDAKSELERFKIRLVALDTSPSDRSSSEQVQRRVSPEMVAAVIVETRSLEEHGFLSEEGLPFMLDCE